LVRIITGQLGTAMPSGAVHPIIPDARKARVESRRGAVTGAVWPSFLFLSSLIEPDVRISHIRLSDLPHGRTPDPQTFVIP
jgi:hypothetical protein